MRPVLALVPLVVFNWLLIPINEDPFLEAVLLPVERVTLRVDLGIQVTWQRDVVSFHRLDQRDRAHGRGGS